MSDRIATCLGQRNHDSRGRQLLYKLDPPLEWMGWGEDEEDQPQSTEYVIVSAVDAPLSGPETYIFAADAEGNITDWGELEGSYRGGFDHEQALAGAGYEVVTGTGGSDDG